MRLLIFVRVKLKIVIIPCDANVGRIRRHDFAIGVTSIVDGFSVDNYGGRCFLVRARSLLLGALVPLNLSLLLQRCQSGLLLTFEEAIHHAIFGALLSLLVNNQMVRIKQNMY